MERNGLAQRGGEALGDERGEEDFVHDARRRFDQRGVDRPGRLTARAPSPHGRGRGVRGRRKTNHGLFKWFTATSSTHPHPNPLPRGEGARQTHYHPFMIARITGQLIDLTNDTALIEATPGIAR